jgi:hypothetical protein
MLRSQSIKKLGHPATQSIKKPDQKVQANVEELSDAQVDGEEADESVLSSSEGAMSFPILYTATAGTFESAGRVILSSEATVMNNSTSNGLGQQSLLSSSPASFGLYQNYPNPFNPATTIQFELPVPAFVTMKVYNILGQEMRTLLNHESMEDGEQELEFDAASLASGVYFYQIVAEGLPGDDGIPPQIFTEVKKMLLVK